MAPYRTLIFVIVFIVIQRISCLKPASIRAVVTPNQPLVKVKEGSSVVLTCKVEGNNAKNAVLFKDEQKVGVANGNSVVLNIDNARPSQGGVYHCFAYSNEKHTFDHKMIKVEIQTNTVVNPQTERIERFVGENVALSCFELLELSDSIEWKRIGDSLPSKAYKSMKGQLIIESVNIAEGGEYVCFTNRQEKRFRVLITPRGTPIVPAKACVIDEATCRNGKCIPRSAICDGRNDCGDNSDETACGAIEWLRKDLEKCDPTEKLCQNNVCKQKYWFCDGEVDCTDSSDEFNCASKQSGELCESWQFLCHSGNQCVNKGFVCDDQTDCYDNSDEIGCVQPRIVRGPVREIEVCAGETVVIDCKAEGFPIPYVNWRWNWGHVCDEPRCFSTNDNGFGRFTIANAVPSDSGAYSCEAINNRGRVFAVDAIVTVKPQPCGVCNCHNHSVHCNRDFECLNCQHNTYGRNCQYCLQGYEGDATRGTPLDCKPIPRDVFICNPDGIVPGSSPRGSKCKCKPGYTGPACNQCQSNAYRHPITDECIPCFCNGLLDATCEPSNYNYTAEKSDFTNQHHGWNVVNRYLNYTSQYTLTNERIGIFEFNGFNKELINNDKWFFEAPKNFRGNRLKSYGGNLSFVIFYEGEEQDIPLDLELRLSGVKVAIQYVHPVKVFPHEELEVVVPMFEKNFRRYPDGTQLTKDHMLMVLSGIDALIISASFVSKQHTASIREFTFDIATECSSTGRLASVVEKCYCPVGYLNGTSCDVCAPGYDKSNKEGQYLGLCNLDCNAICNGHSKECDQHGCYNCKHNTGGLYCDECATGYVGYATNGTPDSCQKSVNDS